MSYTQRSITGRTIVTTSVGDRGDVEVKVYRSGQCVNEFSLPSEKDLGSHSELRKRDDGSVEVWADGAMGIKRLEAVYRNGENVTGEMVLAIPSSTGQGLHEE